MFRAVFAAGLLISASLSAQGDARGQLARGHEMWRLRLANSAIAAFEAAARDRADAAEAHEALGRIYLFKGWQQEGAFPGWHDEPEYRDKAVAELKTALAIDPSRASALDALYQADVFATSDAAIPPATARAEVKALDAKIEAFRASKDAPLTELIALVEARTKEQADPAPLFTAAQIMLDRGQFDWAVSFAARGESAASLFIAENESAYRMSGKSQGALARSRATAKDLVAAAALARGDLGTAAARLEEAEQLSRGQDFLVQYHLGELAMARKDIERAQDRYLSALALPGGPAPLRARATEQLAHIRAALEDPAGFDAWLDEALATKARERREAAMRSLVDRPLPALSLQDLDGRPVDAAGFRGKVLLLTFFSSW